MTLDDALREAERDIDQALVAAWDALAWSLIEAGVNPTDRGDCGAPPPPSDGLPAGAQWSRISFEDVMARQREHDLHWRAVILAELRETLAPAFGAVGR